ncbi:hypothetical protein ACE6H2_002655 [Prunus campanulata]
MHLVGVTSFFISWLANFKLFLLAFGKGPLSSEPSISLGCCKHKNTQNDSIPSLPNQNNKFKENSSPAKSHQNTQNENNQQHKENPPANHQNGPQKSHIDGQFKQNPHPSPLKSHISGQIHPKAMLLLYSLHIYLLLELILAVAATLARALLAIKLEPQRWNLMVTSILRPTIYEPTLDISRHVIDCKWAPLPTVLALVYP